MDRRETVNEDQLRSWILARVRADFRYRTFAEPFGIVRRGDTQTQEPTWAIGDLTIEDWSPDSFVAFERATGEAQRRFDLG